MTTFMGAPGKLFVGGLSPSTTSDSLRKYFEQFGPISDCVLMKDKQTNKSRGFGFVTFQETTISWKIQQEIHFIDGKEVDCKKAIPKEQFSDGNSPSSAKIRKLFVGGLPHNISKDTFYNYFKQYGDIIDYVLINDKDTGRSRGFGFITYEHEESLTYVMQNYKKHSIGGKWIECKPAVPKQAKPGETNTSDDMLTSDDFDLETTTPQPRRSCDEAMFFAKSESMYESKTPQPPNRKYTWPNPKYSLFSFMDDNWSKYINDEREEKNNSQNNSFVQVQDADEAETVIPDQMEQRRDAELLSKATTLDEAAWDEIKEANGKTSPILLRSPKLLPQRSSTFLVD